MQIEKGFIALMSVIIIGIVLLLVVITASLTGFYSRFNVLDFELKERSSAAADACVSQALLNIANDASYAGAGAMPTLRLNSLDSCWVGPVTTIVGSPSRKAFEVQATSSDAVTNLAIVANADDLSIISWREIPNF